MINFESDPRLPLGKISPAPIEYSPELLFLIPRTTSERYLKDLNTTIYGEDVWTAYELSWLQPSGKPQVAMARFHIPCTSACIIESKSFKLYLNSLSNYRVKSWQEVKDLLQKTLSDTLNCTVLVQLYSLEDSDLKFSILEGLCIDGLDIKVKSSGVDASLLKASGGIAEETLFSNLLRTLCPVTNQPDWATIIVKYKGQALEHSSLLHYIISYRDQQSFHEQCVERIYTDIWRSFNLNYLSVYARYLRRGGLDINPFRCSESDVAPLQRLIRQ